MEDEQVSISEHQDLGDKKIPDSRDYKVLSPEEYAAKRKDLARFKLFKREFSPSRIYDGMSIVITNSSGEREEITVSLNPSTPRIESIDLDQKHPVTFATTKYTLHFHRPPPPPPPPKAPEIPSLETLYFDFGQVDGESDQNEPKEPPPPDPREQMIKDLQRKFADLGMSDIPLESYLVRMLKHSPGIVETIARNKADMIMPLYRNLEIKRLLTDPNELGSNYLTIATQRQHVYRQLQSLLDQANFNPRQTTEYCMDGIFDASYIAGVPIFTDENNHQYVVIDYAFSGHDEFNPQDPSFYGEASARSSGEIKQIMQTAQEHGYTTRHYVEFVGQGTHQQWSWHGIRIDQFDPKDLEANTDKVLTILHDVGIDPLEAANTTPPEYTVGFYQQQNYTGKW